MTLRPWPISPGSSHKARKWFIFSEGNEQVLLMGSRQLWEMAPRETGHRNGRWGVRLEPASPLQGGQVLAIGLTNGLTCPSRPLLRDASPEGVPCREDSTLLEEVHVGQAGRGRRLRFLSAPLRPHKSGPAKGGRGSLLSCLRGQSRGVTGAEGLLKAFNHLPSQHQPN